MELKYYYPTHWCSGIRLDLRLLEFVTNYVVGVLEPSNNVSKYFHYKVGHGNFSFFFFFLMELLMTYKAGYFRYDSPNLNFERPCIRFNLELVAQPFTGRAANIIALINELYNSFYHSWSKLGGLQLVKVSIGLIFGVK